MPKPHRAVDPLPGGRDQVNSDAQHAQLEQPPQIIAHLAARARAAGNGEGAKDRDGRKVG